MSEAGEEFWQRQFREADERAALLSEASVAEIVELYHACGDDFDVDFDLGSICFEALQRRPGGDVRAAGWQQLAADASDRRRFGVTLLSVSARTLEDAQQLSPVYVGLLTDGDPEVIQSSLEAISSAQLQLVSEVLTDRVRSTDVNTYNPKWESDPLPSVLDLAQIAPLICHDDPKVRDFVSHSVRWCGDLDATAILLGLTLDSDTDVRAHAALALGREFVGGPIGPSVERLNELAGDDSPYMRACAITALVELGQVQAEALVEAELRAHYEAKRPGTCVWPLTHLASRRPGLISDELKEMLRARWG